METRCHYQGAALGLEIRCIGGGAGFGSGDLCNEVECIVGNGHMVHLPVDRMTDRRTH